MVRINYFYQILITNRARSSDYRVSLYLSDIQIALNGIDLQHEERKKEKKT